MSEPHWECLECGNTEYFTITLIVDADLEPTQLASDMSGQPDGCHYCDSGDVRWVSE